jgi:hypothetical protein
MPNIKLYVDMGSGWPCQFPGGYVKYPNPELDTRTLKLSLDDKILLFNGMIEQRQNLLRFGPYNFVNYGKKPIPGIPAPSDSLPIPSSVNSSSSPHPVVSPSSAAVPKFAILVPSAEIEMGTD